jgi:NADH-quinone oxidoreductase subunit I
MAITVKKVDRNVELTFWERMYIPEMTRGMFITWKHFFMNFAGLMMEIMGGKRYRKIATIYYPEETPPVPVAYRGRPVLVRAESGLEKCVACGLCEVACPPHCISIVGGERENGDRYPISYTLDGSRCIFCGFCEEVCPKEAIVMSHDWKDLCTYDRSKMIYTKEDLLYPERNLKKRLSVIRDKYYSAYRYRDVPNLKKEPTE